MNINSYLLQEINPHLNKYGLTKVETEDFFNQNNLYRQRLQDGLHIIKKIMDAHGKSEIANHLYDLSRIEPPYIKIDDESRDHVVHSLQTYVLGIYLNEFFLSKSQTNIEPFQWKIAGLFHDIGYPTRIAREILKTYSDQRNNITKKIGFKTSNISFQIRPVGFEELCNGKNSFDLIQQCLKKWKLDIDIKSDFETTVENGKIRHGAMSALSVLNSIDLFYQRYNPKRKFERALEPYTAIDCNQTYFVNDIIPACSAIFIHDLPPEYFRNARINREKAPLAFLLKIADCLQEWQRPCSTFPKGLTPDLFNIEITPHELIYSANIPGDRKNKIKKEITGCLDVKDVRII